MYSFGQHIFIMHLQHANFLHPFVPYYNNVDDRGKKEQMQTGFILWYINWRWLVKLQAHYFVFKSVSPIMR